nr:hypothetical protein CFP56_30199 [Quercus suber]
MAASHLLSSHDATAHGAEFNVSALDDNDESSDNSRMADIHLRFVPDAYSNDDFRMLVSRGPGEVSWVQEPTSAPRTPSTSAHLMLKSKEIRSSLRTVHMGASTL